VTRPRLDVEQSLEEVRKAQLLVRGILGNRRPLGLQPGELQLLTQGGDPIMLQVHGSTSSSSS
jgi:hypothetical protein